MKTIPCGQRFPSWSGIRNTMPSRRSILFVIPLLDQVSRPSGEDILQNAGTEDCRKISVVFLIQLHASGRGTRSKYIRLMSSPTVRAISPLVCQRPDGVL